MINEVIFFSNTKIKEYIILFMYHSFRFYKEKLIKIEKKFSVMSTRLNVRTSLLISFIFQIFCYEC